MKSVNLQTDFFPKKSQSYGGILLRKAKNRTYARPISTSLSMHLVLRSSKAVGEKSFKTNSNQKQIQEIIRKFSVKYGVQILSLANVGNHLHFHVKIAKRQGYIRFIRAITAAIAMAVTGKSRWNKKISDKGKFWDYRPFTRIVQSLQAFLNLRDYVQINQLEGLGVTRHQARMLLCQTRPLHC
jgi:REP element-mobilizing transposase RayT